MPVQVSKYKLLKYKYYLYNLALYNINFNTIYIYIQDAGIIKNKHKPLQ
jgi:hypothetical protein